MISDKAKILRTLISDFSEEWWFASWLSGIEHSVWCLGNKKSTNSKQEQAKRIVDLGKEWGIWVYWNDELVFKEGYCVEELSLDEWLRLHDVHMNGESEE